MPIEQHIVYLVFEQITFLGAKPFCLFNFLFYHKVTVLAFTAYVIRAKCIVVIKYIFNIVKVQYLASQFVILNLSVYGSFEGEKLVKKVY